MPDVTPYWKQPPAPKKKRWGIQTSARTRRRNEQKLVRLQRARDEAFRRDGWRCRVCGSPSQLHAHHVRRRSQGGRDEASNLLTVCAPCHRDIHDNPADSRERGLLA